MFLHVLQTPSPLCSPCPFCLGQLYLPKCSVPCQMLEFHSPSTCRQISFRRFLSIPHSLFLLPPPSGFLLSFSAPFSLSPYYEEIFPSQPTRSSTFLWIDPAAFSIWLVFLPYCSFSLVQLSMLAPLPPLFSGPSQEVFRNASIFFVMILVPSLPNEAFAKSPKLSYLLFAENFFVFHKDK